MKTRNIVIAVLSVLIIAVCGFVCYYIWNILSDSAVIVTDVPDTEDSAMDVLYDEEFYGDSSYIDETESESIETEVNEPIFPKGQFSISASEVGDPIVWLRNYIESNRVVYSQAEAIGLPCSGYTTQEDVSDTYVSIMSTVDNTDVATYTMMLLNGDTWEVSTEPLQNKYGDTYPIMYFENGVPSDSCALYEKIYEYCATPDTYSTSYQDNEQVAVITDITTGEVQEVRPWG